MRAIVVRLLSVGGVIVLCVVSLIWLHGRGFPTMAALGAALAATGIFLLARYVGRTVPGTVHLLFRAPIAFAQAVLPLTLAVVVVLFFASRALSVPLQIGAGVLLLAVTWVLFLVEGELAIHALASIPEVIAGWIDRPRLRLAIQILCFVVLFVALLVVILIALLASPLFDAFSNIGGWLAVGEALAILLWIAAVVMRLFGFAVNFPRVVVVVLIGLAAWRFAAAGGIAPLEGTWRSLEGWGHLRLNDWLLILAAVFVVQTVIEASWSVIRSQAIDPFPPRPQLISRELGFTASVLAAAVLGVTLFSGIACSAVGSRDLEDDFGPIHPTASRPPPSEIEDDGVFARTYAPLFYMHDDEHWPLADVDDFLADAKLINEKGELVRTGPLSALDLPRRCDDGRLRPCYSVTCRNGDGTCSEPLPDNHEPGQHLGGAVYAQVLHRDKPSDADAFIGPSPWGKDLTILVQYWLFYRYNRWQAVTLGGIIRQQHEGDWESVTVGLADSRPLFVALSAHCGGETVRWHKVDAEAGEMTETGWRTGRLRRDDPVTHPVVAVALGSHANYAFAWHGRPPDWASCKRIPGEAFWALSYASNVRDRTADDWLLYPRRVQVVTQDTPPMNFPGYWGASDRTTLRNFRIHKLSTSSHGPSTPPLKRLWKRPVLEIFCNRHWRGEWQGRKKCSPFLQTANPN